MSTASICVLALTAASAGAFSAGRPATALARASATRRVHSSPSLQMNIFNQLMGGGYAEPCVMGDESIMSEKAHGTSDVPVQENLRWNCDQETAGESRHGGDTHAKAAARAAVFRRVSAMPGPFPGPSPAAAPADWLACAGPPNGRRDSRARARSRDEDAGKTWWPAGPSTTGSRPN